jgi:hypothetical protein
VIPERVSQAIRVGVREDISESYIVIFDPFRPEQIISREYTTVRLQCWRPKSAGKPRRYWIVQRDQQREEKQSHQLDSNNKESTAKISPPQQPSQQLQDIDSEIYYQPENLSENDPWHYRTSWPQQFHRRPLRESLWAAETRVTPHSDWIYFSTSCPLISSAVDEEKIMCVWEATKQTLLRCLDTVESTAPVILCWTQSYFSRFGAKPLKSHKTSRYSLFLYWRDETNTLLSLQNVAYVLFQTENDFPSTYQQVTETNINEDLESP